MSAYYDLDFHQFTKVPDAVDKAFREGDITLLGYLILRFWHQKAVRRTGLVQSFRAELILNWLAETDPSVFYKKRLPSIRTIRRHVGGLVEAGWADSGYIYGKNTPYDVNLCNYSVGCSVVVEEPPKSEGSEGEGSDKSGFAGSDVSGSAGGDKSIVRRRRIKSWRETSAFQGSDEQPRAGREKTLRKAVKGHLPETAITYQSAGTPAAADKKNELPPPDGSLERAITEETARLFDLLGKIPAEVLQNTRGVPRWFTESRCKLFVIAYGADAVERDFRNWCEAHREDRFPFPVSEYLKAVDSRLGAGTAPSDPPLNLQDPQVAALVSFVYEKTSTIAPAASIAKLLLQFSFEEIKSAVGEYTENLTEREMKSAMRRLWANDGVGVVAVVTARRRAEAERITAAS